MAGILYSKLSNQAGQHAQRIYAGGHYVDLHCGFRIF